MNQKWFIRAKARVTNVRTWVTNEIVTAAQLNQEVRDNLGCFAVMIAYTDGVLLSGWSDYSATAGGRYIVATPTSGTTGGTVGAAMTNLQNKTHLHTGPSHTHTGPSHTHTGPSHTHDVPFKFDANGFYQATPAGDTFNITQFASIAGWNPGASGTTWMHRTTAAGTGATGADGTGATGAAGTGATGSDGTQNTGSGSTGDFAPYIQLLAMKKST